VHQLHQQAVVVVVLMGLLHIQVLMVVLAVADQCGVLVEQEFQDKVMLVVLEDILVDLEQVVVEVLVL
jgi:hypothetical protein